VNVLSKKKLIILSVPALLLILIFLNLNSIKQLLPYFDSQNITTLSNFFITKEEINEHLSSSVNKIDIDSIAVYLDLDMKREVLSVKEQIIFRTLQNVKRVFFNLNKNMFVEQIKLDSTDADFVFNDGMVEIYSDFIRNLPHKVNLKFRGKPEEGINFYERDTAKYLYTINEPISASGWMACNDSPNDKFYFSLACKVDSGLKVISNGKLRTRKLVGKKQIVKWKTSYPIASYLTALYVGNYSVIDENFISSNGKIVKIETAAFPEDTTFAQAVIKLEKKVLKHLENYFGAFPFPKDKFCIVEIPWNYGGIENQTAIGIGEDYFKSPEMFTELFVHETAHEWWGNNVGISSWDDIWLDEGMANYSEALYWEAEAGKSAAESTMLSMLNGALKSGKLYSRNKDLFANIVYDKSAWVFRMMRFEIGDSAFFDAIRNYQDRYKSGLGNAKKLQSAFEQSSHKKLDWFFNEWIYKQTDFIDLDCGYTIKNHLNQTKINIHQNSEIVFRFSLPVQYILVNGDTLSDKFFISSCDTAIEKNNIKVDTILFDKDYYLLRDEIKIKTMQGN